MEFNKILYEAYETSKHWHLPLFAGLMGSIRLHNNREFKDNISDLGEVPGDNILPKEILISLYSRKGRQKG